MQRVAVRQVESVLNAIPELKSISERGEREYERASLVSIKPSLLLQAVNVSAIVVSMLYPSVRKDCEVGVFSLCHS